MPDSGREIRTGVIATFINIANQLCKHESPYVQEELNKSEKWTEFVETELKTSNDNNERALAGHQSKAGDSDEEAINYETSMDKLFTVFTQLKESHDSSRELDDDDEDEIGDTENILHDLDKLNDANHHTRNVDDSEKHSKSKESRNKEDRSHDSSSDSKSHKKKKSKHSESARSDDSKETQAQEQPTEKAQEEVSESSDQQKVEEEAKESFEAPLEGTSEVVPIPAEDPVGEPAAENGSLTEKQKPAIDISVPVEDSTSTEETAPAEVTIPAENVVSAESAFPVEEASHEAYSLTKEEPEEEINENNTYYDNTYWQVPHAFNLDKLLQDNY